MSGIRTSLERFLEERKLASKRMQVVSNFVLSLRGRGMEKEPVSSQAGVPSVAEELDRYRGRDRLRGVSTYGVVATRIWTERHQGGLPSLYFSVDQSTMDMLLGDQKALMLDYSMPLVVRYSFVAVSDRKAVFRADSVCQGHDRCHVLPLLSEVLPGRSEGGI